MMRSRIRIGWTSILLATLASAAAAQTPSQTPALPVEESDTAVLAPPGPHRLFAFDPYIAQGANVIEGDDPELMTRGLVPSAQNGAASLSRDGGKVYVVETYWSHGNRGARADMLSVYDGRSLALDREIALPGRLLVVPKVQQVATSADGALAYIYDMFPAQTIHVVDLAAGSVATSVDIPGCALAYPFGARSFATICGDGTVGVAAVPASGTAKAVFSRKFFDPDGDPLFENSIVDRTSGEGWFVSFSGKVYPAKLGATATVDKPWSIQAAAGLPVPGTGVQELAWRPGGAQLLALHRATKRLFVLMHPGNHWTHKADGTEVWVLDAAKHMLIRRITLAASARSIAVSQDAAPLLYAMSRAPGTLYVYDATTGELKHQRKLAAELMLVPGL